MHWKGFMGLLVVVLDDRGANELMVLLMDPMKNLILNWKSDWHVIYRWWLQTTVIVVVVVLDNGPVAQRESIFLDSLFANGIIMPYSRVLGQSLVTRQSSVLSGSWWPRYDDGTLGEIHVKRTCSSLESTLFAGEHGILSPEQPHRTWSGTITIIGGFIGTVASLLDVRLLHHSNYFLTECE